MQEIKRTGKCQLTIHNEMQIKTVNRKLTLTGGSTTEYAFQIFCRV